MVAKRSRNLLWFLALLFVAIVVSAVFAGLVWNFKKNEFRRAEIKYANDPAMLYQTVGIKECGYDFLYKGGHSRAVRLEGDDLVRTVVFLKGKFGEDIDAVLYVNAPEASTQHRGQPALLPLRQGSGTYCALGVAGSYSLPLFLEFEAKYQNQIQ